MRIAASAAGQALNYARSLSPAALGPCRTDSRVSRTPRPAPAPARAMTTCDSTGSLDSRASCPDSSCRTNSRVSRTPRPWERNRVCPRFLTARGVPRPSTATEPCTPLPRVRPLRRVVSPITPASSINERYQDHDTQHHSNESARSLQNPSYRSEDQTRNPRWPRHTKCPTKHVLLHHSNTCIPSHTPVSSTNAAKVALQMAPVTKILAPADGIAVAVPPAAPAAQITPAIPASVA